MTFWKTSSTSFRSIAYLPSSCLCPFSLLFVTQLMPTRCGRSPSSCLRYHDMVDDFPDLYIRCVQFSVGRLNTYFGQSTSHHHRMIPSVRSSPKMCAVVRQLDPNGCYGGVESVNVDSPSPPILSASLRTPRPPRPHPPSVHPQMPQPL